MKLAEIHYRAVAVAMMANWAISVAWYSVFGVKWAALTNTPPVWDFQLDKALIGLGFNFLLALSIAVILMELGERSAKSGARWGVILTFLVVLPVHSGKWTWQDKPLLLAIDFGAHLISLVASGLIIGAWRPKGVV